MNRSTKSRLTDKQLSWFPDLDRCDTGGLDGWLDGPTAVDVTRAARLRSWGYRVRTRCIPDDITPKNRLLMGHPGKAVIE